MRIERAVTTSIEVAHVTEHDKRLHGHSYFIQVWADAAVKQDLGAMKAEVDRVAAILDHGMLNDHGLSTMEDIAAFFIGNLTSMPVTRVRIERPTLGYLVEARP